MQLQYDTDILFPDIYTFAIVDGRRCLSNIPCNACFLQTIFIAPGIVRDVRSAIFFPEARDFFAMKCHYLAHLHRKGKDYNKLLARINRCRSH
jgi:hypothetical protein